MKIAICDDEKQFIHILCPLLEKWAKEHNISLMLYSFTDGDELIDAHKNECMDLIILDIIMPLLNGIDAARELRENDPDVPIIFLTSSKEFALDSYEVKAFSYLIKPVDAEKLYDILGDFLKIHNCPRRSFTAQTADGYHRIDLDDVDYLEAQNKKVLVHLSDGRTIDICELFSRCAEIFTPENGFYRCHRSYIVNLKNVQAFSKTAVTTCHSATIPISRNRYAAFKDSYFDLMFGKNFPS